jgi:hypothetical protein
LHELDGQGRLADGTGTEHDDLAVSHEHNEKANGLH